MYMNVCIHTHIYPLKVNFNLTFLGYAILGNGKLSILKLLDSATIRTLLQVTSMGEEKQPTQSPCAIQLPQGLSHE